MDRATPAPPVLVAPDDEAFLNTRTVGFGWLPSTSDDVVSQRLQITSGGDVGFTVPVVDRVLDTAASGDQVTLASDGEFRWRVIAEDRATNTASSVNRIFTVDTVRPSPGPVLVLPASGDFTNDITPFFDWDAAGGDPFDYVLLVTSGDINSAPFTGTTVDPFEGTASGGINTGLFDIAVVVPHPTTEFQATTDLSAGVYSWRIIARDRALNVNSSGVQSFTLDTQRPTTSGTPQRVLSGDAEDNVTRSFTWARATDTGNVQSGVLLYNVEILRTTDDTVVTGGRVQDSDCAPEATGDCEFVVRPTLTPGRYEIRVNAEDRATNTSDTATERFSEGRLDAVQNLQVLDRVGEPELFNTVNTLNPRFQWNPPIDKPSGLVTYEVAISGDTTLDPPFNIAFTPFIGDEFSVECFGTRNDTTGEVCIGAIAPEDIIQITIVTTGGVPDGTHLIKVRVVGTGDVRLKAVELEFAGDTREPGAPELVAPDAGALLNTTTPSFEWRLSSGDPFVYRLLVTSGDIVDGPFDIDVDVPHPAGATATPEALTAAAAAAVIPTLDFQTPDNLALEEGEYRWRVVARDQATNTASSETRTFAVDTTLPAPPVLDVPGDKAFLTTRTIDFEWAPSTSDDVVSQRLQVAGSGDTGFTSPIEDRVIADASTAGDQVTLASDGEFIWRVIAEDRATNTASSVTRTFTVDTVAPGAPALVEPEDDAFLSDETPRFVWNASTGDPSAYRLLVTSGDFNTGPFAIDEEIVHPTTEFQATGDLATGDYQWRVIAIDRALNTASSATRTFAVDTDEPGRPELVTPASGDSLNTSTPVFDWNPSTGDVFDYVLQVVAFGDNIPTGPFAIEVTVRHPTTQLLATGDLLLADGGYEWRVIARDLARNAATSDAIAFTIDTGAPAPPILLAPADGAPLNTRVVDFSWTSSTSDDVIRQRLQVTSIQSKSKCQDRGDASWLWRPGR